MTARTHLDELRALGEDHVRDHVDVVPVRHADVHVRRRQVVDVEPERGERGRTEAECAGTKHGRDRAGARGTYQTSSGMPYLMSSSFSNLSRPMKIFHVTLLCVVSNQNTIFLHCGREWVPRRDNVRWRCASPELENQPADASKFHGIR